HRGLYNEQAGRIEMHLEALTTQSVRIESALRVFDKGEWIHTENSYKYAPDEFEALLRDGGFTSIRLWQDRDRQFNVFYAA
ncbi:MAG: L-histidine N(alpha)-methyltransferase, partial [Betaproteobacteria bacterium]